MNPFVLVYANDHDHDESFIEILCDNKTVNLVTCDDAGTYVEFITSPNEVGMFRGRADAVAFLSAIKEAIDLAEEMRQHRYPKA